MLGRVLLLSFLLGFSLTAYADLRISDSKNWKIADEVNPETQLPTCRAYTTSAQPTAAEFAIHFPKEGKGLPFVTLKTRVEGNTSSLIALKVSSRESRYLFLWKAGADNATPDTFWYVPVDLPDLLRHVRDRSSLEFFLDPKGAKIPLKISLAGSSAVLDQAKKCLGKSSPSADEFFKLLTKEKDDLSPDLGDRAVDLLFRSTQEAYQAYRAGLDFKSKLDALKKQFAPVVKAEAAAQSVFNGAKTKFDQTQSKLDQENAKIADFRTKSAVARADLAALNGRKVEADQVLEQKKAIYLPLKEQMKPYESRVSRARANLQEVESEISRNQSTITDGEHALNRLASEQSQLENDIRTLDWDISSLRSRLSSAESDLNRYDYQREVRRILDNDSTYRNLQNQSHALRQELGNALNNANAAEAHARNLQAQLASCQATPNADCSALANQSNAANSDAINKRNYANGMNWQVQNNQNQIRERENSARWQAESEQRRLRDIRDRIANELRDKENSVSAKRNRINQIHYEISSTRAAIDRARTALPGLRRERESASRELASARAERDAFSKQIGYDVASAEYEAARELVSNLAEAIQDKTAEIAKLDKSIVAGEKNAAAIAKDLEKRRVELATATQKLQMAQEKAKPFHDQAGPVEASLAQESARFKNNRALFQQLYGYLAESLQ